MPTTLEDEACERTRCGVDDEHCAVSLRGARDHILDEVTVTRGVDDGAVVLGGLELPPVRGSMASDIERDEDLRREALAVGQFRIPNNSCLRQVE